MSQPNSYQPLSFRQDASLPDYEAFRDLLHSDMEVFNAKLWPGQQERLFKVAKALAAQRTH